MQWHGRQNVLALFEWFRQRPPMPKPVPPMPDAELPSPAAAGLVPASEAELAAALTYALRFDARGKARRGGGDLAASLAGERLVEHLRRSGFVLMRTRADRPHST